MLTDLTQITVSIIQDQGSENSRLYLSLEEQLEVHNDWRGGHNMTSGNAP